MHWAVRKKKEPMLEASKAETPVTSQAEDLHAEQEAPKTPAYDAMPSSSKQISKCSQSNGKYRDLIYLDASEMQNTTSKKKKKNTSMEVAN